MHGGEKVPEASLDTQAFDLILSSESGRKGGHPVRPAMPFMAHKLRILDVLSAAWVDQVIGILSFIRQRNGNYYRRDEVGERYLLAAEKMSGLIARTLQNARTSNVRCALRSLIGLS